MHDIESGPLPESRSGERGDRGLGEVAACLRAAKGRSIWHRAALVLEQALQRPNIIYNALIYNALIYNTIIIYNALK